MVTGKPPPRYEAITDGIAIRVVPRFMHDESSPVQGKFFWAYTVEIENQGEESWQLMRRSWRIVDSAGHHQMVEGEGVIGQQPLIEPGEIFKYTSGVPLSAPSGLMDGQYLLENAAGAELTVPIPPFSLDSPYESAQPS